MSRTVSDGPRAAQSFRLGGGFARGRRWRPGREAGAGRAIAESGLPRSELHVTTEPWNSEQGFELTDDDMRAIHIGQGRSRGPNPDEFSA